MTEKVHEKFDNIKVLAGIQSDDVIVPFCHWHGTIPEGDIPMMIDTTQGKYVKYLVMDVVEVFEGNDDV